MKKIMNNNCFILVNKLENITSNKIIQTIKKKFKIQKIGHCGTLDPQASGLLIICIGDKTKLASKIIQYEKKYIVIAIIGIKSITDDLDGKINFYQKNTKCLNIKKIKNTLTSIKNNIYHMPPIFSSIKHNGINVYKFARLDIKMNVKKRENKIEKINLIKNNTHTITFIVKCKHGIYIRSIINDLSVNLKKTICTLKIIRIAIKNYTILNSYNYKYIIKNS
ncbi:MAG TPA: tRNA pseudouridine(55) synthase TruB [Candidatus Azoamicus sp.]